MSQRRPTRCIVLTIAFAVTLLANLSLQARTWSDASGSFRIEADIVRILDREVLLKTKDGREVKVAIAKLSAGDQKFLADQARATAKPADPMAAERIKANSAYILETKPSKEVDATFNYKITTPDLKAKDWAIMIARPPEIPSQSKITFSMTPAAEELKDKSPLARAYAVAKFKARGEDQEHGANAEIKIHAQLMARHLKPRPADTPPANDIVLPEAERALYLASNEVATHDSREFKKWLDTNKLRPEPKEGQVDFAKRVFSHLKKNFTYEYTGSMDRHVMAICEAGKSDCGGMSILYAAALRANDIPARMLVGRWAQSQKDGETVGDIVYEQQHVKMEFFADGVGWIPADVASGLLHDKTPEGLKYFGHDRG
ncbi:hypothetical protein AYO49_06425, partial [Verrucomicrobiaceae bacterium SCGC AG-212-N21]